MVMRPSSPNADDYWGTVTDPTGILDGAVTYTLWKKLCSDSFYHRAKEAEQEEVIVDSAEYLKIVEKYTDKNGKLSYELLNKDMIRFAHASSRVRKMIEEGAELEEIRNYVVGTKFRNITGNDNLSDAQIQKMVELLDEVSPKGVFKEFNEKIKRSLKAR